MQKRKGFTLMELLVAITIIGILLVGSMNNSFTKINVNEQTKILATNIANTIEVIKNHAQTGKGIGVGLETPSQWRLLFNTAATNTRISSQYYLTTASSWADFSDGSFQIKGLQKIQSLTCKNLSGVSSSQVTAGIIFTSTGASLSGCGANDVSLEILVSQQSSSRKITFNTMNQIVDVN